MLVGKIRANIPAAITLFIFYGKMSENDAIGIKAPHLLTEIILPDRPSKHPFSALVIGLFVVFFGILVGSLASYEIFIKIASQEWSATSGKIESGEIHSAGTRRPIWCVSLTYDYNVDGKAYRSNRTLPSLISNGVGCFPKRLNAEKELDRLIPGSIIRIYYDPKTPLKAAIQTQTPGSFDYFMALAAATFLWMGGFLLVEGIRGTRSPQQMEDEVVPLEGET